MAVDAFRFGDFSYSAYDQIPDFRSQRYMPESATDIQIRKHANGYLARYTLAADEFNLYLDGMWQQYREDSTVERESTSVHTDQAPAKGTSHLSWSNTRVRRRQPRFVERAQEFRFRVDRQRFER